MGVGTGLGSWLSNTQQLLHHIWSQWGRGLQRLAYRVGRPAGHLGDLRGKPFGRSEDTLPLPFAHLWLMHSLLPPLSKQALWTELERKE